MALSYDNSIYPSNVSSNAIYNSTKQIIRYNQCNNWWNKTKYRKYSISIKRNISKIEKIPLKKKSGFDNIFNKNSLSANYFNQKYNKNRISVILDFLDINEQLPLIKLNSIFSKIVIEKYSLPFKCILPLRQYKNNKNVIK